MYSEIKEANSNAFPSTSTGNELYAKHQSALKAKMREQVKHDLIEVRDIKWNSPRMHLEENVMNNNNSSVQKEHHNG